MQRSPMDSSLKRPLNTSPYSSSARSSRVSEVRLLTVAGAETRLYVLSGDGFRDSRVLQTGDMAATMMMVTGSPVAVVTCQVGDHQWMLARDSLVLRVGMAAFLFSFAGFIYGLSLSPHCTGAQARLAEILGEFSAYQDISGNQVEPETEAELWALSYAKLEHLRCRLQRGTPAVPSPPISAAVLSRKLDKAMRCSAVTKLVSRAFLTGLLHPYSHLHLSAAAIVGALGHPPPALFLPSVRTCSDLVDAMESGYTSSPHPLPPTPPKRRGAGAAAEAGYWSLNDHGVALLVGVITTYTKGGNNNNNSASKRMKVSYDATARRRG